MSSKNSDYYFLKGGGEMGVLIRAKDWSKTSLGDPADWPQSLRTMVAVMLDNPFGMYIAWGNDYIQLYNDGYRPILGASKHPLALGISTRETFSEIWDNIIGSMFDGVMNGKAVGFPDLMLPLNRNGFVEECYFDFSYSPVRKDNGEVGGVLVTVIETTEKKKAQAALIESTDQLKFAMDAAELGTWDYDPFTNKFTANNLLKTWFGLSASEEVELHHATDAIAEKDRDRIILAIKKVLDYSSGGIYEEEYSIINPVTNKEIIVQGKGRAWFNDEKIAYRFNGILQEVTENVLARKKIEDNEEQLRIAIEGGEFGTFDFFPKTNQLIWSAKTKELFGLPPGATVNYDTYIAALHPEDRDTSRAIARQPAHLKEGGLYELEYRTIGITDGKLRWLRSKGKATYNNEGEPIRYTGVIQDITKQKEAEEILRENNKRFRDTVRQTPIGICILRGRQFMVEIANDAYLEVVDRREAEFIGRPLFESLPEVKETVHQLLDDVFTTGIPFHGVEYPVPLNRYGKEEVSYFNFLYHPLKEDDGTISGIIVTCTDVNASVKAKHSLAESEKQFKNLIMQSPIALTILRGKEYIIEMANEAMMNTLWKKSEAEVIGKKLLQVFPEVNDQKFPELLNAVLTQGITHKENEALTYLHNQLGELETFYLDFEYKPLFATDGSISGIIAHVNDVTEEVVARKQIEESEQRFQAAVRAVQGILWTNNAKGEMEGEQPGWALLTGQTYDEYRGYGWAKAIHPDDAKPTVDAWNEAVQERKTFIFEHRVKTKEGQWRDFSIRAIPLLNADGTLLQWVGVHTDITENKQAAKALKANEEKLTIVIEASELGTWEIDVKTNVVAGSRRLHEIMGYSQKNSLTLTDTQFRIHPEYIQLREEAFKKAYDTGVFYFTGQIIWEDNSTHWIESKGKVFYDKQKNPVTIIGTTADITEEKRQQQILSESESKFRLLADSMPQHIWTSDPEGNLNYYNQSVFDYSGLTLEQINRDGWIQIVHPDDKEENIRQWLNAISTGKDFLLEHRFRRHDGEYRWQLSRAIPQRDETGKIQMWVGTSTDIQEQKTFAKELELQVSERTKELEASNTELEKMNKELQSFAYISSHDLQEPLRKIQTFASRIKEKEENNLSDSGKDMFNRMQGSAKRMQTLIQDLLAYSRTNATEQQTETINLNEIIAEVKEDLKEELKEKHATIEANELCDADIIPFQFRQLMHNLIGNSLKFSNPEIPPHIQIKSEIANGLAFENEKLSPQEKYCHISFSDNGVGFEQQYSEKIFEVFQRLHGKNEYNGTGIGLSIVKKIIENHHGIIMAKGELNKGATFDIYIPAT